VFLQDDPLQACFLNLQLLQTYSKVVRMHGESVGSCSPDVFSLADRANTVVEPEVSLVLKLKLYILMLLVKEFSDFVHSKSTRKELVTPTDAQKVCSCFTLHDLMPRYIFAVKGMHYLSGSLSSHRMLCITADFLSSGIFTPSVSSILRQL